jgi:hypothetical protein
VRFAVDYLNEKWLLAAFSLIHLKGVSKKLDPKPTLDTDVAKWNQTQAEFAFCSRIENCVLHSQPQIAGIWNLGVAKEPV